MKVKGLILGLGMMTGLALFSPVNGQAFVAEDEWTDYDPCGWNVEQTAVETELTTAFPAGQDDTNYMN